MTNPARVRELWLLAATFLVAVAGLIYELIAATLSSYILGDSVRQFSIVIGLFLSSMGVGAWASRFVSEALPGFVWAQILLGIVGGFLAPIAYFSYAFLGQTAPILFGSLILVGILSGMEIPLIARVLKAEGAPEFRFERVLTADYLGALVAALAFPVLVIPYLGLMSASLVFGCLNLCVAVLTLWLFRTQTRWAMWLTCGVALGLSVLALVQSERLVDVAEANLYEDDIILNETTPYQQITITRYRDRVRLFLDQSIQFDSLDEYRYHEALVHPAMRMAPRRSSILVLGGGDGMAVREALRHPEVETVTLVDLDPRVTGLFTDHPQLAPLNGNALSDDRVQIVNQDAWAFVQNDSSLYDVIIGDLPDPRNVSISKLYSREFYTMVVQRLSAQGVFVTQAGSPLFAREAFWSIARTLEVTGNPYAPGETLKVNPYHAYVPSFGEWGFVMAGPELRETVPHFPKGLRSLSHETWAAAKVWGPDTGPVPVLENTVARHPLVGYYTDGWERWFR